MKKETYLGEGVYASFDGIDIVLRAQKSGRDETIYLSPSTYQSFLKFVRDLKKQRPEI